MEENNSARLAVTLLVVTGFLGTVAYRLSIPVIAFYSRNTLGASVFDVSVFTAAFMISRALSASLSGVVIEKKPRMINTAVATSIANALVIYLFYVKPDIVFYMVLRGAQGFLNGVTWPIVQYLVGVSSPRDIRGRVLAIYFMSGELGGFAANNIYALIADRSLESQLLLSSILFVATGLVLASSLIILRKLSGGRIVPRRGEKAKTGLRQTSTRRLERRDYLIVLSGFFVMGSTSFMHGEISYVYLSETIGMSSADTALVLAYIGLLAMISSYLISWLADKKSDIIALQLAFLMAFVSPLLISIASTITVLAGYATAMISARSYRPLSRRYLTTYTALPATTIGFINASDNIGASTSQLLLGYSYDSLLGKYYTMVSAKIMMAPLPLIVIYALPLLLIMSNLKPRTS